MTGVLGVVVVGLIVIAGAAVIGPRLGVAAPLVLVLVGIGASFLPGVDVHIEPEWILAGVLPPLLYSSAVSMPAMNFRREFGAIGGLSVVLVVVSSLVLGLFFAWALPGIGPAWGIALGAIVSPTDAVATSIVKRTGVSPRVVAILDGESLLNDATALVLLRTAIASVAAAFSFWGAVGDFAFAVAVAVVIGALVGRLDLAVRRRVTDPTVNTVLSFTVPFVASIPAELLHASGLVAAVVAGLVTGRLAPRLLPAMHRLSDAQNWRMVELVLEGAVFLVMGLELAPVLGDVQADHAGVGPAVLVAAAALVITVLVRAAYVVPLLRSLHRASLRRAAQRSRITAMQATLVDPDSAPPGSRVHRGRRVPSARDLRRYTVRLTQMLADIDYFRRAPLGWREGTAVVWAGMRGAVTVAAAQTLPHDTPQRSLLVLVAFTVATLSLLVQGGTLGPVLRRIGAPPADPAVGQEERQRLRELLTTSAATVPTPAPTPASALTKEHLLRVIAAQREALLDARDGGTFDAETLESALALLDADQIRLELRARPIM